jgi:hypothetical protein
VKDGQVVHEYLLHSIADAHGTLGATLSRPIHRDLKMPALVGRESMSPAMAVC